MFQSPPSFTERSSRKNLDRMQRGEADHIPAQVPDVNNYRYTNFALYFTQF